MSEADYLTKLLLGDEQARTDPTFDMIALVPTVHIAADSLYNRRR